MTDQYKVLCTHIEETLSQKGRLILSIDGCCGSGKTTLAKRLAERFEGDIVQMDDFFLPMELRTQERLESPGGNVHYERFLSRIVTPLLAARQNDPPAGAFSNAAPSEENANRWPVLFWEHLDCVSKQFDPIPRRTAGSNFLIVEGSYSMRPEFRCIYDMTLCLTVPAKVQKERIISRNGGERYADFRDKWIPMENHYLSHYKIAECCQTVLDGTKL